MFQVHGRGIGVGATRCKRTLLSNSSVDSKADDVLEKKCDRRHPPGRKVYQRGAHTIWEVDGAKEKVSRANDP